MSRPWLDSESIPIERLWGPVSDADAPVLVDDQGYLLPRDPYLQRRCLANDGFDDVGLAMLRGESGAGKTYAIAAMMDRLQADKPVHYVDLARVDTRQALHEELRSVLDASAVDPRVGYVFLDDLEKCQLHAVDRHLDDILRTLASKAIRVRIAYRAGSLTQQAELRYRSMFASACVVDLLPLTRCAVLGVLATVRHPAEELLESLEQQDLVPLLVQPVTLRMIVKLIAAGRPIHAMTRCELYEQSCRLLCERRPNEPSSLDVEQRLAIARRLAAISVFCNRPAFFHRAPDGKMPSALLPLSETLRGQERIARGDVVAVTEGHALEVLLRTGLFSAVDQDTIQWSHNSIADYLASEYVRVNELPIRQVNELVRLSDANALVLPQLEGVLGWLVADPRLDLIERMMARAPRTLLRSDVTQLPESARRAIVHGLLEAADREMLSVWDAEISRRVARARYPTLFDELRPWIQDAARHRLARVLAIRIAGACGFGAAASSMLLAITLDPMQPLLVRCEAAITIRDHGEHNARMGLRPLVIASDESDERDDLKGEALRALWPAHLTSRELFASLSVPRDPTYLGAYAVFLGRELSQSLTREVAHDAVEWVLRQHPLSVNDHSVTSRLIDTILRFSLRHLDDAITRGLVADVFVRRRRAYVDLLPRMNDADVNLVALLTPDDRRALIEAIVERLEASDPSYLICAARPMPIARDDTQWLLARIRQSTEHRKDAWIEMIVRVVQDGTDEDKQHVLEAVLEDDRLRAQLRWFAGPIELGSTAAAQMREEYELQERRARTPQPQPPTLSDSARQIVESTCAGDLDAFVDVYRALSGPSRPFGSDRSSLSGWAELSDGERAQVTSTAREYLLRRNDRRAEWLGRGVFGQDAVAGLRALHLLATVSGHETLRQLPDEVWEHWTGIIIAWPLWERDSESIRRVAIANVVRAAPRAATQVVADLLAERSLSIASTLDLFPTPWPIELIEIVGDAIPDSRVETCEGLLRAMFVAAPERAETIAWQIANNGRAGMTLRAVAYKLILLRAARPSRLRAVEHLMTRARLLAHAVFVKMADEAYSRTPILRNFDEDELARLFIELERRYPGRKDPDHRGMHMVRAREQLGRLRHSVLYELQARSSAGAIAALRTILATFEGRPNMAYLHRMLVSAELQAAETDWDPPTPQMLLTLVADATRSYVETSEELADVVVESLQRLDQQLNGSETPMAELLWNTGTSPSPKVESSLSNLIKNHLFTELRSRRLVINREVEILPSSTGVGRRPDLHVVATRPDGAQLTVYVEVKRCDNRHRGEALESQLIQQYLRPTGNRVGIYVVGHYDCAARRCCTETREELRSALHAQARAAAPEFAIHAIVLDTSLPASMIPRPSATRR